MKARRAMRWIDLNCGKIAKVLGRKLGGPRNSSFVERWLSIPNGKCLLVVAAKASAVTTLRLAFCPHLLQVEPRHGEAACLFFVLPARVQFCLRIHTRSYLHSLWSRYVADDVFFGSERSKGNDVLSIPEFARERVSQDSLGLIICRIFLRTRFPHREVLLVASCPWLQWLSSFLPFCETGLLPSCAGRPYRSAESQ